MTGTDNNVGLKRLAQSTSNASLLHHITSSKFHGDHYGLYPTIIWSYSAKTADPTMTFDFETRDSDSQDVADYQQLMFVNLVVEAKGFVGTFQFKSGSRVAAYSAR